MLEMLDKINKTKILRIWVHNHCTNNFSNMESQNAGDNECIRIPIRRTYILYMYLYVSVDSSEYSNRFIELFQSLLDTM